MKSKGKATHFVGDNTIHTKTTKIKSMKLFFLKGMKLRLEKKLKIELFFMSLKIELC